MEKQRSEAGGACDVRTKRVGNSENGCGIWARAVDPSTVSSGQNEERAYGRSKCPRGMTMAAGMAAGKI